MSRPIGSSLRPAGRAAALAAVLWSGVAAAQLATAPVEFREVDATYAAEGVVEAVRQATVAAQVQGRIVELKANAGDAVKQGQVLARIDEREAAQAVASSEAQVARAQADFSNARVNLERTRKLVAEKFVSAAALDKAQAEYDAARAALDAARAGAGQAGTVRSYTVIVAPFAGVVAERHVDLGDMAQPGKPMFTIFDPAALRVVAAVPEDTVGDVRAKKVTAYAELPALDRRLKPKLVTVLPAADARTHTKQVRLDLADDAAGAYPGMFARAHFATGRTRKLVIPAQAVAIRSEVAGTYVVGEKGEIRFRQLRLGEPTGDGAIEVLAGVAALERVALDPVAALAAMRSR